MLNFKNTVDRQEVFVIAEIGKNFIQTEDSKTFQEYVNNAKELIKAAKDAGANAVKFQTHNIEDEQLNIDVVSPHFVGSDRYSWVKRNNDATPLEFWKEIKKYADEIDIIFFSTPMSRGAARILEEVGVDLWKVGSGDILDFVTLDYIAQTGKSILISSGMSSLDEVDKAIDFLKKRTDKIVLLHCVSKYPCSEEELNLGTISFFKKRYDIPVGFSDHSLGHRSTLAATEKGAVVIEKHFSLSRDLWGADHKVSMTPHEFKSMVDDIRGGKKVKLDNDGDENKILQDDEAVFRPFFRKSLMFSRDVQEGETIVSDMIYAMRPQKHAGGLSSEEYENVIGKHITKNVNKYDPITKDVLL